MVHYIKTSLFLSLLLFLLFTPSIQGEEVVHIKGDTMRVQGQEELMILEGNVYLQYNDLEVAAHRIEFQVEQMVFVATGSVRLREGDQFLECEELTYYLDDMVSILVDARARFHDEETGEDLYFSSPYIEGDEEKYQVSKGDVTPCSLKEPHIFFRANSVVVYPGDYLIATHVVFWELGGYLPLFYWPVLYLSLEDDQDIMPSFGYSQERGWYIKLAYHYFEEDYRGIYYLDYYSITGLGTGLRHYYLEEEDSEGTVYLYILENKEKETGWDYFTANLSHRQSILDWRTSFGLDYNLIPQDRERYKISLSTATQWEQSRLDLRSTFDGEHRLTTESWSRSLISRMDYRLSLPFNSLFQLRVDPRILEDDEGLFSIYEGEGKITQRGSAHTLDLLLKQDRPRRYERDAPPRFTALPEISLQVNPARLYSFDPTLSRYLNPLRVSGLFGNYVEESTDTEGIKLQGEYRYNQTFRPFSPLTLNLSQRGDLGYYFTEDDPGADHSLGVTDTRLRVGLRPIRGLDLSLDYNRRFSQGDSPFSFDRVSDREDLASSLSYSWRIGRARLSTSYSLLDETYGDLKGDLTLTPIEELRLDVTASYSIEDEAFKGLVAQSRFDYQGFRHDLAVRVDRDFEIERVDTEFLWEIEDLLELGLRARYHPQEKDLKRGEVVLVWDLHCREISISYDHVKEEYWFRYSIPAFPGQKVSIGRTPDDPMLFDLDLGGIIDD